MGKRWQIQETFAKGLGSNVPSNIPHSTIVDSEKYKENRLQNLVRIMHSPGEHPLLLSVAEYSAGWEWSDSSWHSVCSCVPLTVDARSETRSTFAFSEVFLSNVCQLQHSANSSCVQNPVSHTKNKRRGNSSWTGYSFGVYEIAFQVDLKTLIYSRWLRGIVTILHRRSNFRLA